MAGQSNDYLDLQAKATRNATLLSQKAADATAEAKALRNRADNADDQAERDQLAKQSQEATERAAKLVAAAGQADHQADLYGKAASTQVRAEVAQTNADHLRAEATESSKHYETATEQARQLRQDLIGSRAKTEQISNDLDEAQESSKVYRDRITQAERDGNSAQADEYRTLLDNNEQRIAKINGELRQAKTDTSRIEARFAESQQQQTLATKRMTDLHKQVDAAQKEATDLSLQADGLANDADDHPPDPAVIQEIGATDAPSAPDDTPAQPDGEAQIADQDDQIPQDPSDLDDTSPPAQSDAQPAAASASTDSQISPNGQTADLDDVGSAPPVPADEQAPVPSLTDPEPDTAPDVQPAATTEDTADAAPPLDTDSGDVGQPAAEPSAPVEDGEPVSVAAAPDGLDGSMDAGGDEDV